MDLKATRAKILIIYKMSWKDKNNLWKLYMKNVFKLANWHTFCPSIRPPLWFTTLLDQNERTDPWMAICSEERFQDKTNAESYDLWHVSKLLGLSIRLNSKTIWFFLFIFSFYLLKYVLALLSFFFLAFNLEFLDFSIYFVVFIFQFWVSYF